MKSLREFKVNQGFTLLEVLIAVMVLSIGLLGLANLQSVGVRVGHDSELRTRAAFLAYEVLDIIRANSDGVSGRVNNPNSFRLAFGATSSTAQAAPWLQPWLNRIPQELPNGQAGIEVNGNQIVVTLSWRERGGNNAEVEIQRFVMATQVRT